MSSSVARWVSIIAHPFVMIALLVVTSTLRLGRPEDITSNLGLVVLFSILPVVVLTIRQVRRGIWANVDASLPSERAVLYAVGISGIAALVLYLVVRQPDSFLLRGSTTALILLVVCAVIARWTKVSLHVAAAALTATVLLLLGSSFGWLVACVIPLLIWSRLALGRHKSLEVVLGLGFGIVAGVAMYLL